jgi:hypothetical protein
MGHAEFKELVTGPPAEQIKPHMTLSIPALDASGQSAEVSA